MDVFQGDNHTGISIHIQAFLDYLGALGYSQKSITSYKHALGKFQSFLQIKSIDRVQEVTPKDLEAYRLELVEREYSDLTIGLYLRAVRKLFNHLEATHLVFMNPAENVIIPTAKTKLKPVPTEAEMERLLLQPNVSTRVGIRDRAILETFYSTGVRLGEMVSMNIKDTDLKGGRLKVLGKGDRERVVPLGKQATFWIDRYLVEVRVKLLGDKQYDALWLGAQGARIHHLIIERFVSDYGKRAGITHPVTPHTLRRACASHMLRGGAHPVKIQMLLGHSSMRVLSNYLKVTITDLKKTHAKGKPGK